MNGLAILAAVIGSYLSVVVLLSLAARRWQFVFGLLVALSPEPRGSDRREATMAIALWPFFVVLAVVMVPLVLICFLVEKILGDQG